MDAIITSLPRVDGRHKRAERSRAAILSACREFMEVGCLRPPMTVLCRHAGCSLRTGFQHFRTVDALYTEALTDRDVRGSILDRVLGPRWLDLPDDVNDRVLRAVATGKA